jgi:hypothetical protein
MHSSTLHSSQFNHLLTYPHTYPPAHTHAMAPSKKTPASDTKDKGVLQPSKAGVKKATKKKAARDQAVEDSAGQSTQSGVKRFRNGLFNFTKLPDQLIEK